jgi:hydroxymethylpyrimidine/phosphomethylpyrimidine kinase
MTPPPSSEPTTPPAPRVLSIAGTDPTGGAGIHADLKSIAANGGYGMAVVTALVAQNTVGVRSIHRPPTAFLRQQLDAVSDDVTIDAVKIGMLFDSPVAKTVGRWLRRTRPPITVLDPVMVTTSGSRLLSSDTENAILALLEQVDLITPNMFELAALLGEGVGEDWQAVLDQSMRLSARHHVLVLAKGGHLRSLHSPDALVDAASGTVTEFTAARIASRATHGTGCSLSSAVATIRPRTTSWQTAIEAAKGWLSHSISEGEGLEVGAGNGPISHFAELWARPAKAPATSPIALAEQWWSGISSLRTAIYDSRFVRELAAGSLHADRFAWYLAQDALYLREYARVLAYAAALAPTAEQQAFWANSSYGAIATELALHANWIPASSMFDSEPSETTTAYVDHLLAIAARADYDCLISALLPCFWLYLDVGTTLVEHSCSDHPYREWLQTYSADGFAEATQEAIGIVMSQAARASASHREAMRKAFDVSANHELRFFEAPSRQPAPVTPQPEEP